MSLPSPPSSPPSSTLPSSYLSSTNGTTRNRYSDGSAGSGSGSGPGSGGRPQLPLPHIKDLEERATEGLNANQSINHLVKAAEASLRQAIMLLEYRKPDQAYVEYLRAFEIVVTYVQQNHSFPDFRSRKGPPYQAYMDLAKRLNNVSDQFDNIKLIIDNDNKRNGTQPRLPASLLPGSRHVVASVSEERSHPTSRSSRPPSMPEQDLFLMDPVNTASTLSTTSRPKEGAPNPLQAANGVRNRPTVSPKPERLHAKNINPQGARASTGSGSEALNERFARLRMMPGAIDTSSSIVRTDSKTSLASSTHGSPVMTSSPAGSNGRSSFDMLSPVASNSSLPYRPSGPRSMPNGVQPSPSGFDFGFDAQIAAAMPKPPDAAYNPARNMQISGNIDLPRSSARSIVGTGGRSNSMASSASSIAPGNDDESAGYFPKSSSNGAPSGPPRRKSVHLPLERRIGPEKLYDYLKMHNVLLIDVRNREDFDQGHVFAHAVICIEPTALRRDMSADQLQDSLVLSPEMEQGVFYNRNQYDLVVYYDQRTSSDAFLHYPKTEQDFQLRFLHDALYEYNHDKPLQRPPILLMGGIDAWADLVGDQALMTSNTASRSKGARPIRRVPVANGTSRLHVAKKRLRDYNPLGAEEEQKWRERARVESVTVDQKAPINEEDESALVEDATPFYETIDEFNRRFPDAGVVEHQTFGRPPSRTPPIPPKVPDYPAPRPPSAMPAVPSRPAPALPRMSYSGVNDRSVSQTSQKSVDLPAYVSPRHLPSNLRLPRTGLVNFGVTCYMNATIQALSATTPLTLFFLDDRFKTQVQRDNWKGSKGVLPELFANLVRSIWKGDVEAIRPTTLRSFCARLNREWGIDRQQDAKEFFDFLLDCLHEDLNANWSRTPLRALTSEQEIKRERMPKLVVSKKEWDRYCHREQSYLTTLFGGQHASRLRCTTCHFTSTTYEAFYSISVEIPRSGKGTIQDCLKSYCAEEMLSGDEVWKCPQCNKEREATKQITITRAPQFLVVHFKRFSAGRGQSARKVRTPIDFPLHNLDLEPYMLASPTAAESQSIARDYGAQELKSDVSMTPPYAYDAYAVMRHIGTTLTSGHYTCLARDRARGSWRHFNDTSVGDFDPERLPERDRLQNEMAYIVFYQRMDGK